MKPTLYMMIGLPGSGKTTFIQHMPSTFGEWVSRDAVRFQYLGENDEYFSKEKTVFKTFVQMIYDALACGEDVIADATHISLASRKKLIYALHFNHHFPQDKYDIVYIWMDTDYKECLRRNAARTGRACVPESSMQSMHDSFVEPSINEFYNLKEVWRIVSK